MKAIKFLTAVVCCLSAISFTSCNPDSDVKTITPQERKLAFEAIKGDYSGSMVYPDAKPLNGKDLTDTLSVKWQIDTDSTMYIREFPVGPVASHIKDEAVRKALETQAAQSLKCYIGIYRIEPIGFLINPSTLTYNVTYGGAQHKVQIVFYTNSSYSYGMYASDAKRVKMQIVVGGIYVDGKLQSSLLASPVPFKFSATR